MSLKTLYSLLQSAWHCTPGQSISGRGTEEKITAYCASIALTSRFCCSVEVQQVLGYKPQLYHLFNGLLLLLVVLHVYWFAIICKIALAKVLQGKEVEDTRED